MSTSGDLCLLRLRLRILHKYFNINVTVSVKLKEDKAVLNYTIDIF